MENWTSGDHTRSTPESNSHPSSKDAQKHSKTRRRSYAWRIHQHVKLGPKFWDTVKGKLNVGATIIRKGGRENVFKSAFGTTDGEQLLKASQCYLSTTAGPIAGTLFTSTEKVGFLSETLIALENTDGTVIRTPYKVSIPVKKIKGAYGNEDKKFIEIVTEDNFEFWFMGFVRYEKALLNLVKTISLVREEVGPNLGHNAF